MAIFVAGSVLALADSEREIGERIRSLGFDVEDVPERPEFPLRSLTGFFLILILFLLLGHIIMLKVVGKPGDDLPFRPLLPFNSFPFFLAVLHITTIACAIWVILGIQPSADDIAEAKPRWELYLICALIGFFIPLIISVVIFVVRFSQTEMTSVDINLMISMSINVGCLSGIVSFLSDGTHAWPRLPINTRLADGLMCSLFMLVVSMISRAVFPLPPPPAFAQQPALPYLLPLFPLTIAFLFGYFIPHICRHQRALIGARASAAPVLRTQ